MSARAGRIHHRKGGGRGAAYTMIEVMVALGILAVGAAGIIALQRATYISSTHARNLTVANSIATSWAERLRVDALQWNDKNGPDLTDTKWLKLVSSNPDQTVVPTEIAAFGSPVADVLGSDAYAAPAEQAAFCTHVRFSRAPDLSGNPGSQIIADIRVFWSRSGDPVDCSTDPAQVDVNQGKYGAVYLTTSVLRNNLKD